MVSNKRMNLSDGIGRPYSTIIDDIFESGMNINNKQYYDLISNRPEQKTYIQIDQIFSKYNQNSDNGKVKNVNGLADITKVIDVYRNNTLYSINDGYRNNGHNMRGKSERNMYDAVV
jgi:hypothetical protein